MDISAAKLRSMDLRELKELAQKLGINLTGLEDRESALYTRIVQHASEVTPSDA